MDEEKTDVVVVGGGLAGLTCGVGLAREGVKVTVLESTKRLGGRAQSWIDEKTGDPVHIGPHIFLSEYPNMFKLMESLGTMDKIVWQDDRFITLADGRDEIVMKAADLPAPLQFVPALFANPQHMRAGDVASNMAITFYALQMDENDVMRLDDMNAYAFLRRMGVTKRMINQFWAFASMAIMNVPIELCSAGAIMRFYKRILGKSEFYFGFPDGGLGDVFAPQSQAEIEAHGGEVRLNSVVARFLVEEGRVVGVELEDGEQIRAQTVIAALPPTTLRELVPTEWLARPVFEDLVHFHPSPYVSSFIWFDQKLTDLKMWARTHHAADLNCDFYDLSNIHTGWEERPSVITSNIIYSERVAHLSDEEVVAATVGEIADFLPEASMDGVTHYVVNRIPMAIHCPYPGTEQRRPDTRSPVDGLLLAGDWIKTGLPSSMESAAMSGWVAAETVLQDLGRPRELAVQHEVEGFTRVVDQAARYFPPKRMLRWARRFRERLEQVV